MLPDMLYIIKVSIDRVYVEPYSRTGVPRTFHNYPKRGLACVYKSSKKPHPINIINFDMINTIHNGRAICTKDFVIEGMNLLYQHNVAALILELDALDKCTDVSKISKHLKCIDVRNSRINNLKRELTNGSLQGQYN
jgi:hypothetical protein